jgi:hypothetical protein
MTTRNVFGLLLAAFVAALPGGRALAQSGLAAEVQAHFYAGRTAEAAAAAEARLAEAPDDGTARFALGAAEFLQAVEHLGQGLHRYGLHGEASVTGMVGLPILRLPVPVNPRPDPLTYEAFGALLVAFVEDLAKAEATLAALESEAVDLPLDIGLVRLDLNGDGTASDEETLWRVFQEVAELPWLDEQAAADLRVDFDASDVPWLQAYCHVLMAIAEFPLAHDWRPAFDATFHGVFPDSGLPGAALNDWARRPPEEWGEAAWLAGAADLVAFLHLNHWPVAAPERMASVLAHLQKMPPLSRENWRRILAETDNRNEWIPSPRQSGALPGLDVTHEQIAGWMLFLDEFEALLGGTKLLPHWRFEQGINLRRLFLEPTTFDIVLLIQGSAALPYLEDGELTESDTWRRIMQVFGGDFFRYAVWFN